VPALTAACRFIEELPPGFECLVVPEARVQFQRQVPQARFADITDESLPSAEVIVVFGGDGTILRAAERALDSDTPVLGVNLGHVGFLAELEVSQIPELVSRVVAGDFVLERRMTIVAEHFRAGEDMPVWRSVAINEVSLEKASRMRMVDCLVSIDGLPVSRWACDGILVSTPTGSTAYAFSAGGPVMWPQLEAFQVVPLSAHALFARSMVLAPNSKVRLDVLGDVDGFVCCDGARSTDVSPGDRLTVQRSSHDLIVARLSEQPFTSRLVKKFALPIEGWRGQG
jgi:NAD+ kinase